MLKKISLALGVLVVVGLLYFGFSNPTSAPVSDQAVMEDGALGGSGGNVTQQQDFYTNGVGIGPGYVMFSRSGTIALGSNQASWRNTTGRTVYVDLAFLATSGVASSSYKFYVATSTSATISSDFTAPYSSLVNGFTIATSSVATTTSSIESHLSGSAVVPVASGQYVNIQVQAANGAVCNGVICETATSTNRGFTVAWYLRAFFKP
jgi:hypothetical protein